MLNTNRILFTSRAESQHFTITNTSSGERTYEIWFEGTATRFRIEQMLADEYTDRASAYKVTIPTGDRVPIEVSFWGIGNDDFATAIIHVSDEFNAEHATITLVANTTGSLTERDLPSTTYALDETAMLFGDKTSFALARTNPKLTGNIRITVDTTDSIYLGSFDAHPLLSNIRFKKVRVGGDSSYAADLREFWANKQVDNRVIFHLHEKDGQYLTTKTDYAYQYDDFYMAGAGRPSDWKYAENLSVFAPLWVREKVPDHFIIFRVPGAVDVGSEGFTKDIIAKSTVVFTYDLSERTAIGRYIRSIAARATKPPVQINFTEKTVTYSGVSIEDGIYASKVDYIGNLLAEDDAIIEVEEYITLGFERNGIACANLLNLEFLFTDDQPDAEPYGFDRYFGVYVSEVELGTFTLDVDGFRDTQNVPTPRIPTDLALHTNREFIQTNDEGIRLYVEVETGKLPQSSFVKDQPRLFYVKDRDGVFHGIRDVEDVTIQTDPVTTHETTALVLDTTELDLSSFTGIEGMPTSTPAEFLSDEPMASMLMEIVEPEEGDVMHDGDIIRVKFGQKGMPNHYVWTVIANSRVVAEGEAHTAYHFGKGYHTMATPVSMISTVVPVIGVLEVVLTFEGTKFNWEIGEFRTLRNADGVTSEVLLTDVVIDSMTNTTTIGFQDLDEITSDFDVSELMVSVDYDDEYITYFSPEGSAQQVAASIAKAFGLYITTKFDCSAVGNLLAFNSRYRSEVAEDLVIEYDFRRTGTPKERIKFNGITAIGTTVTNTDGVGTTYDVGTQAFIGGALNLGSCVRISKLVASTMTGDDWMISNQGLSKLRTFMVQGTEIAMLPYLHGTGLAGIDDYAMVYVNEKHYIVRNSIRHATVYKTVKGATGVFSVFPIRDLDFDFHSTEYGHAPHAELKRFFLPYAAGEALPMNTQFVVDGSADAAIVLETSVSDVWTEVATITVDSSGKGYFHTFPMTQGVDAYRFRVTSKSPAVYPYFGDVDGDLLRFRGFAALSDFPLPGDDAEFEALRAVHDETRFIHTQVASEYDRLKENATREYALRSRVVPYVNKWVRPGGRDVRDNPYRFNLSAAFGPSGLAPDANVKDQTPDLFTHEWPYLDAVPVAYPKGALAQSRPYFFSGVSLSDLKSVSYNGFLRYFVVGSPTEVYDGESVDIPVQERYTFIRYNRDAARAEVFFRGAWFTIHHSLNDPSRFDDYKFSAVVKHEWSYALGLEAPVQIEIIDNQKWKALTVVIKVRLADYKVPDGVLDYLSLYTLRDQQKLVMESGKLSQAPGDVLLSTPIIPASGYSADLGNRIEMYTNLLTKYRTNLIEELHPTANGNYPDLRLFGERTYTIKGKYITGVEESFISVTIPRLPSGAYEADAGQVVDGQEGYAKAKIPYRSWREWYPGYTYLIGGGAKALTKPLKELSFANLTKALDEAQQHVETTVVSTSGTIDESQTITLRYLTPTQISREHNLVPVIDSNKPAALRNYDRIGYTHEPEHRRLHLYRYDGPFEPKSRPIVQFGARETVEMSDYYDRDFLLLNTRFLPDASGFGVLKNFYFIKHATGSILQTTGDDQASPLYPLIGEVAIDKMDLNVLKNTWETGHYTYPTFNNRVLVEGSVNLTEVRTLFGSKAMRLPTTDTVTGFEIAPAGTATLVVPHITYEVMDNQMLVKADFGAAFISMVNDRLSEVFEEMIADRPGMFPGMTATEAASKYLEDNIMHLYEVTSVDVYRKRTATASNSNSSVVNWGDHDEDEWDIIRDIGVRQITSTTFEFTKGLDAKYTDEFSFVVTFGLV